MKTDPDARFDAKFRRAAGCWIWTGAIARGYGKFWSGTRLVMAHRFAWERAHGPISPGLCVCHTCDVPNCVRPDHLFLGTNADNAADKVAKGRQSHARGELCGMAKLTRGDVARIRRAKGTHVSVAASFNVTAYHVGRIRRGVRWPS